MGDFSWGCHTKGTFLGGRAVLPALLENKNANPTRKKWPHFITLSQFLQIFVQRVTFQREHSGLYGLAIFILAFLFLLLHL